ncbi:hypothetical protein, partial [Chitinophaga hostae]
TTIMKKTRFTEPQIALILKQQENGLATKRYHRRSGLFVGRKACDQAMGYAEYTTIRCHA